MYNSIGIDGILLSLRRQVYTRALFIAVYRCAYNTGLFITLATSRGLFTALAYSDYKMQSLLVAEYLSVLLDDSSFTLNEENVFLAFAFISPFNPSLAPPLSPASTLQPPTPPPTSQCSGVVWHAPKNKPLPLSSFFYGLSSKLAVIIYLKKLSNKIWWLLASEEFPFGSWCDICNNNNNNNNNNSDDTNDGNNGINNDDDSEMIPTTATLTITTTTIMTKSTTVTKMTTIATTTVTETTTITTTTTTTTTMTTKTFANGKNVFLSKTRRRRIS